MKKSYENGVENEITALIRENDGFANLKFFILEYFTECKTKQQAIERTSILKQSITSQQKTLQNPPKPLQNPPKACQKRAKQPSDYAVKNEKPDIICEHCSRQFTRKDNLRKHKNGGHCKVMKEKINDPIAKIRLEIDELKSNKNNQIVSTQTNSNNTQNNTQNNIQNNIIIEMGQENVNEILTNRQKLKILEKRYASLEYLIKYLHCNPKFPQFQCINVPSITKSHCNVYSKQHGKFIATKASDAIDKLVGYRMDDIQTFLEETPDVPEKVEIAVKGLVNKMGNDEKYKKDKCNKIRIDMHNNL